MKRKKRGKIVMAGFRGEKVNSEFSDNEDWSLKRTFGAISERINNWNEPKRTVKMHMQEIRDTKC